MMLKRTQASGLLMAAAIMGFAGTALAQQAPRSAATPEDASLELEEVVVTAQRRREDNQTVPIAITVIDGHALEDAGFRSVTDLQYLASSLQYDPANGGLFQIRGVGSGVFDYSIEQSVSLVVDGVVLDAQRDPGLIGLNDIDQVEVLRGPQGTLFGKNSTSGAISVTTHRPVLGETSGSAGLSYGERNDRMVSGTLNLPLGQEAALRLSAFEQGQDGYGTNEYLHRTTGTYREAGVRAKLLFVPMDDLQIQLNAEFVNHYDNATYALANTIPTIGAASIAAGVMPGPNNVNTADPLAAMTQNQGYGTSLEIIYDVGGHRLTSITAYRNTFLNEKTPADFVPIPLTIPANEGINHTNKVSEELRLASATGQFLEYVAGLYFNRLTLDSAMIQWGELGAPLPPGLFISVTGAAGTTTNQDLFNTVNQNEAAFGQVKLNFTERLSLIAGGRFTHDQNSQSLGYGTVPVFPAGYSTIAAFPPPSRPSGSVSHSNFSYTLHPTYAFAPNTMGYLTYSTGYKGPGIAFIDAVYDPYRAETVKSYEAGVKSELFERRLRLNADVFYEKFTDFQAQTFVTEPVGPPVYAIGNAAGVKSQGVEADWKLLATRSLSLNGSVTYAISKFTDYIDGATNYTGQPTTNAPLWSATFAAQYKRSLGHGYMVTAAPNYAWRSEVYTSIGDRNTMVPAHGLLGGTLGFAPEHGPWQFGIYARNLLNKHFSTSILDQPGIIGVVRTTSAEAFRTVGASFNYSF